MELLVLIPILFVVMALVVGVLRLTYGLQLKRERIWGEVASRHGLRLDMAPAGERQGEGLRGLLELERRVDREIDGELGGARVALRLVMLGTVSNNQARVLEGEARLGAPLPEGAEVCSRGLLSMGGTPTGDAAFDKAFKVSGLTQAQQGELLTPAARGALLSMYQMTGEVQLRGDRLLWRRRGQTSDARRLEALLLATAKAGRALDGRLAEAEAPAARAEGEVFLPGRAEEAEAAAVEEAVTAERSR